MAASPPSGSGGQTVQIVSRAGGWLPPSRVARRDLSRRAGSSSAKYSTSPCSTATEPRATPPAAMDRQVFISRPSGVRRRPALRPWGESAQGLSLAAKDVKISKTSLEGGLDEQGQGRHSANR